MSGAQLIRAPHHLSFSRQGRRNLYVTNSLTPSLRSVWSIVRPTETEYFAADVKLRVVPEQS